MCCQVTDEQQIQLNFEQGEQSLEPQKLPHWNPEGNILFTLLIGIIASFPSVTGYHCQKPSNSSKFG